LVNKRYYFFAFSLCIIIPGVIAMVYSTLTIGTPFRVGIDFTGGSFMELRFDEVVDVAKVRDSLDAQGYSDAYVQSAADGKTVIIRTKYLDNETKNNVMSALRKDIGDFTELRFESVGPTIGREVTRSAFLAIVAASVAILLFIIFAFHKVPHSFRFGLCAIIAMVHDVLVLLGIFSILGIFFGWQADSLILTAILTVTGFSVQYTIVVFDRIRENVPKRRGESFEMIANRSLLETLHRSLVTQLNAMFVLIAILLFGGETIKQFVFVLFYGFLSGTYSSIFVAVPLLVAWENGELNIFARRRKTGYASAH